jgi:ribosomal protein S18 acetylase RimI-like enzyme
VDGDREARVPLLLEADESDPVLRSYLNDGDLYDLVIASEPGGSPTGEPAGVALLISPQPGEIEIKNIALAEGYRGRGLGRASVDAIVALARSSGARSLQVGTSDTSSGTIAFYLACGFRHAGTIPGFFDAYPEPVIEDGVQAHDMVRFEMDL